MYTNNEVYQYKPIHIRTYIRISYYCSHTVGRMITFSHIFQIPFLFKMITMVCEYAAVPYIFSEGSSRNQVAPTTSFPPPPVTWNAKDTLRRSSTSSTTELIKQNEAVDQPTTLGTGDGGDPPPENNIEMTEQTHDTETPTQLQKEETKF